MPGVRVHTMELGALPVEHRDAVGFYTEGGELWIEDETIVYAAGYWLRAEMIPGEDDEADLEEGSPDA